MGQKQPNNNKFNKNNIFIRTFIDRFRNGIFINIQLSGVTKNKSKAIYIRQIDC